MGTDVSITVGRITNKALTDGTEPEKKDYAVALFNDRNVAYGDIQLQRLKDNYYIDGAVNPNYTGIPRIYSLFAWLSGVRGGVKPAVDADVLRGKTEEFLKWMFAQKQALDEPPANQVSRWAGREDDFDDFTWSHGIRGDAWVFYPVIVLWEFNYDQVALVTSSTDYKTFVPHPEGFTYRYLFGDQWFKFLNHVKTEGWDFIIFSFD